MVKTETAGLREVVGSRHCPCQEEAAHGRQCQDEAEAEQHPSLSPGHIQIHADYCTQSMRPPTGQRKPTSKTGADTEMTLTAGRGESMRCLREKGDGINSTDWWLQSSHREAKHSIGNIANSIVITMYGTSNIGGLPCTAHDELCCTSENNN